MSGEDRVFIQWSDGSFITLTDPDLITLVRLGGVPKTVEFRAHDEGYITSTLYDPDGVEDAWVARLEDPDVDDDPDDLSGQLDRMVDKDEITRAVADEYLRVNQGDEY
jgi:hypothetical protein